MFADGPGAQGYHYDRDSNIIYLLDPTFLLQEFANKHALSFGGMFPEMVSNFRKVLRNEESNFFDKYSFVTSTEWFANLYAWFRVDFVIAMSNNDMPYKDIMESVTDTALPYLYSTS